MTHASFILVTAIVLILAFALGWAAHALVHRFARVAGGDMDEVDRLARELHEAEELRDQAIAWIDQREGELTSQLTQTEAELRATMDGLRDARVEAEDLRQYVETLNARG
jgi:predicted TIM-barrel fold metal-dependent hydrolase